MANNKMLIDASHPEETRVAIVKGNRVDEFDFESEHKTQIRGNIYLAKVTRVEPSLQAAFVDYGGNRHGFLAFSEIHPDYYQIPVADRQALLDAEAEDARIAAEAEAKADEDADTDSDDDENGDEETTEATSEKPARKRRSRRRGGRKSSSDETDAAEGSDDAVEAKADDEQAEDTKPEPVAEQTDEESDDSDDSQSADNDGDDVVSEPANADATEGTEDKADKKPKRRAPRKKKAAAEDAENKSDEPDGEAEETKPAPRKTRRVTSRKKKAETEEASADAAQASDASASEQAEETAEADAAAAKPKKRTRRTSRKKAEAESTDDSEAVDAVAEEKSDDDGKESEDSDSKEAAKPARSRRSRGRGRKSAKTSDDSDTDENGAAVEEVGAEDALEEVPVRRISRRQYKIQEVIKRRQILLVQVVKEERGTKGAALTTYLSLAGRYSVLMPNTARGGGISRKITNASDRKRLKSIAGKLEVPQGMGVILRTAGASRSPEEIQRDFEYLMRLWENVRTLTLQSTAPCLTYEEGSLIKRSIRDLYDKDTGEVIVAGEAGFKEAKEFMSMLMPEHAKNVRLYRDKVPMFTRMGVETQLDAMLQPQVTLKSGGYLIIDQTEALVAIDVNSGRSTRQHSVEDTATQTNLEAADEVARQLRLRDLAGLIVIDFIDMEDRRNIRSVEKRLKDALKNDRARIQVGRISHFGLMEMSRQRIRASVLESTTQLCPVCEGLGHVRSASSVALTVLRAIEDFLNRNDRHHLTVKVSTQTALYLLNSKRESLSDLEARFGVSLTIETDHDLGLQPCVIEKGEPSKRKPREETAIQPDSIASEELPSNGEEPQTAASEDDANEGEGRKRKRRRRRRRGGKQDDDANTSAQSDEAANDDAETPAPEGKQEEAPAKEVTEETVEAASDESAEEAHGEDGPAETQDDSSKEASQTEETSENSRPRRRTTRRVSKKEEAAAANNESEEVVSEPDPASEKNTDDTSKPKRSGWWQRKFF
ncbi:MAG: Rne/Rng family ribonuclease [Pseudomonadota bacterium]